MAKKNASKGPSASQAIRDYCTANPEAGPKDVAAALVAQGYSKVTPTYVSTIKSLDKAKNRKKGAGKPGRPKSTGEGKGGGLSLDALLQAKKLAEQLGGVANAQAALDALAKLGA